MQWGRWEPGLKCAARLAKEVVALFNPGLRVLWLHRRECEREFCSYLWDLVAVAKMTVQAVSLCQKLHLDF